jgi:hypothetical protein
MSRGVSLRVQIKMPLPKRGVEAPVIGSSTWTLARNFKELHSEFLQNLYICARISEQPTMSFRGAPRGRGTGANFGGGGGRGGGGFGGRGGQQLEGHTLQHNY